MKWISGFAVETASWIRPLRAMLCLMLVRSPAAQAAVLFSGDFGAGSGQVQFTRDISFTLTSPLTSSVSAVLVFNEAVTSDGSRTFVSGKPETPLSLEIGGVATTRTFTLVDNLAATAGAITPNDSYLFWSMPTDAGIGTVITVKSGTYLFNPVSGVNPQLSSLAFVGDMFLSDPFGVRISSDVSAVPEASQTACLTAVFLAAAGGWRRRMRRAGCLRGA